MSATDLWDEESGAGTIPKDALGSEGWVVLQIPAGQAGTVDRPDS